MAKHKLFIRYIDAGRLFEIFIISSITAILGIRLYLKLTNYPQVGGESLHIAHMLWGGLLMLISIIIFMSFLNRATESIAACVGGLGFGTFIDEIGKFVTQDHNYFFEPSVAIIYVIFILAYMGVRAIHTAWVYSSQEFLLNAIRELEEVVLLDLDEREKTRALDYLQKSKSSEPVAISVKNLLNRTDLVKPGPPFWYERLKNHLRRIYQAIVHKSIFSPLLIIFFTVQLIIKLVYVVVFIFFAGLGWEAMSNIHVLDQINQEIHRFTFIEGLEFFSSLLSAVFVLLGILTLKKSRLRAYKYFDRSILISILITQVFMFYDQQFNALLGLGFNLLILLAIRFLIDREIEMNKGES